MANERKFPTNKTKLKTTGQPVPDTFNEESLIESVETHLGYPLVNVELDLLNYKEAIKDAFTVYSRFIPRFLRTTVDLFQGQMQYHIPYIGRGIVDVQPNRAGAFLVPGAAFSLNLGDGIVSTVVPTFRDQWGVEQINETMIYSKMWRQILSWDFQWEGEGGYLYVANIHPGMTTLSVVYTEDQDFKTIPRGDRDWIEGYTLAKCKQMLGEVRSKFATPGPASQQMILRTLDLIREGREEELALYDQLRRRARTVPPSWDDRP